MEMFYSNGLFLRYRKKTKKNKSRVKAQTTWIVFWLLGPTCLTRGNSAGKKIKMSLNGGK